MQAVGQHANIRGIGCSACCSDMCWGHLNSYKDEPGSPEVIGSNREIPVKHLNRVKRSLSKKMTWTIVHLNAHSMSNKQEEMEAEEMCW